MESCCNWPEAAKSAFETADYLMGAGRKAKQHSYFWTKNFRVRKAQACDYLQNYAGLCSTFVTTTIKYTDLHKI